MAAALTTQMLMRAYAAGIFPMAESRQAAEIRWIEPARRGIFPLDGFHISRSLARRIRLGGFEPRFDGDFVAVLDHCADRAETWINAEIRALYIALHREGRAHAQEIWIDGALAGGVYGVTLGTAFFGESMFSARTDGSKLALCWLIDRLRLTGFTLFDVQFLTPHLKTLGAVEIGRHDYLELLSVAIGGKADITRLPAAQDAQAVLQRNTQTS